MVNLKNQNPDMKLIIKISAVTLIAAGIAIAQAPAGPAQSRTLAPGESPASLPPPKTVTQQTYPAEQVQAGEGRFTSLCGFCHGRDAAGGETGPDLTRSALVAQDTRGDKIGPLLKTGRPDRGMPSFDLTAVEVGALVCLQRLPILHRHVPGRSLSRLFKKEQAESQCGEQRKKKPDHDGKP